MGKRILIGALCALMFLTASCAPAAYRFAIERSGPSVSGLDLSGKSICVVYAYSGSQQDSLLAAEICQGFVSSMEEDYFLGADAVPLYNLKYSAVADYASEDSLVGLIMDTETDVVFLFHSLSAGDCAASSANVLEMPFTARLSVYDSMSAEDTVREYDFSDTFLWSVQGRMSAQDMEEAVSEDLPNASFRLGSEIAGTFAPVWTEESHTIILYDNDSLWMDAAEMAVFDMKWADAMKIWMAKADTGDMRKSSSAAYNCALGCFILGDYDLAERWLDYSDSVYRITYSSTLRNRLDALKAAAVL